MYFLTESRGAKTSKMYFYLLAKRYMHEKSLMVVFQAAFFILNLWRVA